MARAEYEFFIDWYNEKLLSIGSFENGHLEGWAPSGSTPALIELDDTRSYVSHTSMRIDWRLYNPFRFDVVGSGFDQGKLGSFEFSTSAESFVFGDADYGFGAGRFAYAETSDPSVLAPMICRDIEGLTVGRTYTVSLYAYVPSTDGLGVGIAIDDDTYIGTHTSETDQWQRIEITFEAADVKHTVCIVPSVDPSSDAQQTWIDNVSVVAEYVDVKERALSRDAVDIHMGRDAARNLDSVEPGEVELSLLNRDYRYTPDNEGSPLYDYLEPGKQLIVKAHYNNRAYTLFAGYTDTYQLNPRKDEICADLGATDLLALLAQQQISTPVLPVATTGQAIHAVLDAVKWPADQRDIDPGATVIRYWSEDDTTGLEAVHNLIASEGMPAIAYVSESGSFVFRDRHHRYLQDRSQQEQAVFSSLDDSPDPRFRLEDWEYDVGFDDLVNSVSISVSERHATTEQVVWESETPITLLAGETKKVTPDLDNPVIDAQVPIRGELVVSEDESDQSTEYHIEPSVWDFTTAGAGSVSVKLSRTSGSTLDIIFTASGGDVVVSDLRLRATPIESTDSKVELKDKDSIQRTKERSFDQDAPWVSTEDAKALAEIILGHRARRLPTVSIGMYNRTHERLTQQLERQLSDRIHIVEPESFTDRPFYIERIEHSIYNAGKSHETVFSCEAVRDQVENVFTFDDPDRGFNDGLFGYTGISDASNILTLDNPDTGLGMGFLAF